MTTKITEQNISNLANAGVQWQAVKTSDFTAVAGEGYFVDTTSAAVEVTLPSSPSVGDTIVIKDYASTFGTNALTIDRNGNNIQGVANNSEISTNRASIVLVYIDATKGWLYTNESNVADLQQSLFTSATGGTITTSGDYKIHTFTGDGCFVVSTSGNGASVPTGGPAVVDYLVVAGGGAGAGGGGGGGGAGGFRESSGNSGPYTASPLATPTGITVSAITYPITVGGGGSASPGSGSTSGSPSTFSTITSTGGGKGVTHSENNTGGLPGGSGGGGSRNGSPFGIGNPGGSGNTPPVSPPQGNNGGAGNGGPGTQLSGGGGGGAGGSGTASPSSGVGGAGGNGVTTSITASPVTRAGGGGGGGFSAGGSAGSGGAGAGATGGPTCGPGGVASVNTGSGGGGGGTVDGGGNVGGSGGSGIVIIRYKFQ